MAKKRNFLIVVCLAFFPFYSISQNLIEGIWKVKESKLFLPNDTLVPYSINQAINKLDLSKLSYDFSQDNTYSGTSYDETVISGTWSTDSGVITIDGKSGNLQFIGLNEFVVTIPFVMTDSTNQLNNATSILTFYNSNTVGKNEITIDELFFLPTFSDNEIHIHKLPDNKDFFVQIINAYGQILFKNRYLSQSEISIPTFDLPNGYYWIWIFYQNNVYYKKTLVLHK